ncbi:MAG: hypothetical protein Q8M94_18280 [Ignavibacteria bacterium]|nr:hypothetical protein [Ignavibacteria bacterium]
MSEMLGNHYFQLRDFVHAERTYEKLSSAQLDDLKILKKLIICYTQTHKIAKALQYLLVLMAKDISTILENNRNDEDCPCNELIFKIENEEIKYSTEEEKYTALAILWIYCNHKTSLNYFQMALNENPQNKNLIKMISFIKELSKQNILETN